MRLIDTATGIAELVGHADVHAIAGVSTLAPTSRRPVVSRLLLQGGSGCAKVHGEIWRREVRSYRARPRLGLGEVEKRIAPAAPRWPQGRDYSASGMGRRAYRLHAVSGGALGRIEHAEKIKGPLEGQHHQEALCGQSFAQTVQYGAEVIARRWLAKGEGAVVLDGPTEHPSPAACEKESRSEVSRPTG